MRFPSTAIEEKSKELEFGEEIEKFSVETEGISNEERVAKVEEAIEELSEEEKEDIKKVLLYLDRLLESLPEDKIKEFASSEYYDLYMRIFDKLNLR
ncbi:MAG: hypothetical protein ABDH28_03645 [Brevinematia bacterium]